MWPALITASRLACVTGTAFRNMASIGTFFSPSAHFTAPSTFLPLARDIGGGGSFAAQVARVLPHRHGLRAHRHAVQRGVVTVLARHRHALQAAGRQRCHHTAGHAVVGGHHRVDLVAVLGEDLLHVLLRGLGLPAVGVLLADDLDVALLDRGGQHFLLARAQEVGVRVGGRALDHHVVALRLGGQHRACLHAADFLVVEGDVEHAGRFDQAVVGDHGNALGLGLGQRRARSRPCPSPG